jgi:hypothetical protein
VPTLTSPLRSAGTAAFRLASRVRGERAIHARGRTLTGTLTVPGGAGAGVALLDAPGTYEVLLRVSRSAGLPLPLPDVLGLAVRVLDAHGPGEHQDLLLDSALPQPLLRRLPFPRRDHLGTLYCSLLPYDVAGTRQLLGARALHGSATLDHLPDELDLALLLATPHGGWRPWGTSAPRGCCRRRTAGRPGSTRG